MENENGPDFLSAVPSIHQVKSLGKLLGEIPVPPSARSSEKRGQDTLIEQDLRNVSPDRFEEGFGRRRAPAASWDGMALVVISLCARQRGA